ncbi:hydrolase [Psychrobacillus sp. FSL H8-0484]|uniref:hydrolase n=1 Tax=Psychrobacillus sp. FSL H8-0484 TaxID=2921390 RepID=UPI0030F651CC
MSNKKKCSECKGCVCDQLRRLQIQTEVDVFLLGGQVLEDVVFISIDRKNCCAVFTDPTTEPGSTLIVDCQDIQAIRIEAD